MDTSGAVTASLCVARTHGLTTRWPSGLALMMGSKRVGSSVGRGGRGGWDGADARLLMLLRPYLFLSCGYATYQWPSAPYEPVLEQRDDRVAPVLHERHLFSLDL